MCWAGHAGTTEQPTCCIRCPPINGVNLPGLPLTRRFKKATMLAGESFDFYKVGFIIVSFHITHFYSNNVLWRSTYANTHCIQTLDNDFQNNSWIYINLVIVFM